MTFVSIAFEPSPAKFLLKLSLALGEERPVVGFAGVLTDPDEEHRLAAANFRAHLRHVRASRPCFPP